MFTIKNIRSDDHRLIAITEAFLINNQDGGVRIRPNHEIKKAMDTGQALVVERDGCVCGCSLIYKFAAPSPGSIFSEIGTMRIIAEGNGYGLQEFLAKFHLINIYLDEFYHDDSFNVFAVVEENTASEHNLVDKVGMRRWTPPEVLTVLRSDTGVAFSQNKYAILAEGNAINQAFDDLSEWHKSDSCFATPKKNGTIQIDIGWFHPEILRLQPNGDRA